ncbi:MAG: glycogen-binding domain-containing protein [Gemmatimonadaceae bacterium]
MTCLFVVPPRTALTRCAVFAPVLLALLAPASYGQRVLPALEIGGSSVRYNDSASSSAATISPFVRLDADRLTIGAGGTLSQSATGWSAQGTAQSSVFTPSAGMFLGELSGSVGGSTHEDRTRTGQTLAVARAHLMSPRRGAWAGAGAGAAWDGAIWRSVRTAELGAWQYAGAATALATVTPTAVGDTIRYTDGEVAIRFDLPRADIGLMGGARAGDRLPSFGGGARTWSSASATGWIAPSAAIVASIGTYPVDFTQGFPGGRYVSLGLRFGARTAHRDRGSQVVGSASSGPSTAATTIPPAEVTLASVLELRVGDPSGGRVTLRVLSPRANSVEIMGDFTDWSPVRLASAGGGWWTVTLPMRSGTHELNVRASGAAWTVPPGLPSVSDEFGGAVGVLVVP